MNLPTGSAIERAMACPASCVLTRAGHTGEAAVYGSEQHKAIEDGDLSKLVVRLVLDGAEEVRHEVAYALDVDARAVREIGVSVGRNYGKLKSSEIALTIDIECRKDGTWWVGDWKSRSRVSPVAQNWQIRAAVIAVMSRHGADTAMGFLGYLDDSELEVELFDAFHVAAWWDELREMVHRIRRAAVVVGEGGAPDVNSGTWCQYCPALPYCPAHTRLALSMLGELDSVGAKVDALTLDQCGRAWELLKRYDVLADRVRDSIKARASREIVPLTNGRRLALVECKGRMSVDSAAVEATFREMGREVPKRRGRDYVQVKEVKVDHE